MPSALGTVALTASEILRSSTPSFVDKITVVGDAAYPAGGTAGLRAALRALTKDTREPLYLVDMLTNGGYVSRYDHTNDKILLFKGNGAAVLVEETATTNTSGTTFSYMVVSR
jgi:hypothetical protein